MSTARENVADAVLAALRWDELIDLPDQWEDASSEWYYEHRHNPDNTIDYAQGFEDGWDHAASLLRAHFAAMSEEAPAMSTAREVIAQTIYPYYEIDDHYEVADAVLAALKSAGYILLDPTGGTV